MATAFSLKIKIFLVYLGFKQFFYPQPDYLTSELQAMRMIGGDEDRMEIDDQVLLSDIFNNCCL